MIKNGVQSTTFDIDKDGTLGMDILCESGIRDSRTSADDSEQLNAFKYDCFYRLQIHDHKYDSSKNWLAGIKLKQLFCRTKN